MTTIRYSPSRGQLQVHYFDVPATDDQLRVVAPSIFATGSHPERTKTSTYQLVNTWQVITAMRESGWQVMAAGQRRHADPDRWAYARHLVRLRHKSLGGDKELVPEAILLNAHDGSASWTFFGGAFRFVCGNGLIAGEILGNLRLHHTLHKSGLEGVTAKELTASIMAEVPKRMGAVEVLKAHRLTQAQMLEYFGSAIEVRWPRENLDTAPCTAQDIATYPWLDADYGLTAWQVFNHAQRVLVTLGGMQGRNSAGRVYVSKPITRVDEHVRVNTGLWSAMLRTVPELARAVAKKVEVAA